MTGSLTLDQWLQIGILAALVAILAVLVYALATARGGSSSGGNAGAGILERLRNEPALLAGFVGAVVALLASFGLELPADAVGGIMAVLTATLAVLVRRKVTPVRKLPQSPDQ